LAWYACALSIKATVVHLLHEWILIASDKSQAALDVKLKCGKE